MLWGVYFSVCRCTVAGNVVVFLRNDTLASVKKHREQRQNGRARGGAPASKQQANRVRRSAELSGLISCISNGKAAVSPSASVTGYQSQARPRQPGGKHSLLCAHQRSSSPLTHSMMGFKIRKKKKLFPRHAAKPRQTHQHQHVSARWETK